MSCRMRSQIQNLCKWYQQPGKQSCPRMADGLAKRHLRGQGGESREGDGEKSEEKEGAAAHSSDSHVPVSNKQTEG